MIGRNHALKENVFIMVVCIDLRIPLFLVGRPGSSKSLAKDVVKNAMRGDLSNGKLFKRLKQVHMVSYQCSPLSTADGVISTFTQCQKMQQENDPDKLVACVVLDEVGLAEDSPRLPLKFLNPLLDDGTAGADDDVDKEVGSSRVAFVSISNWALDPAKMNRGIFVQRAVPTYDELVVSAEEICSTDLQAHAYVKPHVAGLSEAYFEIFNGTKNKKAFFGLTDFYSLVKMVFSFCRKTGEPPTWNQFEHAIKRNFGGLVTVNCVEIFGRFISFQTDNETKGDNAADSSEAVSENSDIAELHFDDFDDKSLDEDDAGDGMDEVEEVEECAEVFQANAELHFDNFDDKSLGEDDAGEGMNEVEEVEECAEVFLANVKKDSTLHSSVLLDSSPAGLILANLSKADHSDRDEKSRYLLLLTENYAALAILRQQFLVNDQPVVIFGGGFFKDQEDAQICRIINRIEVCMATGRTVVLLNLEKLYDSLCNQCYVQHGGQKFVDLGLGSHRVKCQVHNKFRLILIANRKVVNSEYRIPLLSRMEKQFLAASSILTGRQRRLAELISQWVKHFSDVSSTTGVIERRKRIAFRVKDAFIGYHPEAAAAIVRRVYRRLHSQGTAPDEVDESRILTAAYEAMLQCATPDAVARLSASAIREQASDLWDVYFTNQNHSSLADFVKNALDSCRSENGLLIQVTTHSRLLSSNDAAEVGRRIGFLADYVFLQQFDTEYQFATRIRDFYSLQPENEALLIILCESCDLNGDLVACACYVVQEIRQETCVLEAVAPPLSKHVAFVIHLPRMASRCCVGFQGGAWIEFHIDDLRPANQGKDPSITSLVGRKMSELLEESEDTYVAEIKRSGGCEKEIGYLSDGNTTELQAEGNDSEFEDDKESDWQTMQAIVNTENETTSFSLEKCLGLSCMKLQV